MKITEIIEVSRPVDQVWDLFQDVPELATCLPGAEITEDKGDGKYAGAIAESFSEVGHHHVPEAD